MLRSKMTYSESDHEKKLYRKREQAINRRLNRKLKVKRHETTYNYNFRDSGKSDPSS